MYIYVCPLQLKVKGTSNATAQPASTPTELGLNHKCLSCDTSSDSKELLQEHNQQALGKKRLQLLNKTLDIQMPKLMSI